jgi:hypothetical protein
VTISRAELEEALQQRNFDAIVGHVENLWFDAKDQPYKLDTENGKRELAKDVAAFANSQGGTIVVGLRTAKSTSRYGDEVTEVRLLAQGLVDPSRYRDVILSWVFPAVEGFESEWIAEKTDPTKGLFVLRVPEQRVTLKPFLVVKTIEAGKVLETLFGYSERRDDVNAPMGIVELQRALRTGLNFERTLDERLSAIEATLRDTTLRNATLPTATHDRPPEQHETPETDERRRAVTEQRIARTMNESDFADERSLAIVARPIPDSELRTIFTSAPDSIRKRIENPPAVRAGGWDLSNRGYAEILRAEMLRAPGFRKTIDLYRDGTMIFACVASEDFLAWTSANQKLHPLGVVELFYNFVSLYQHVLEDLREPATEVELTVAMRNLHKDGMKTRLGPGGLNSIAQMFGDFQRTAPDDTAAIRVRCSATPYVPQAVAFDVLRQFYLWFGIEEDKVPYTAVADGRRVVDVALLQRT